MADDWDMESRLEALADGRELRLELSRDGLWKIWVYPWTNETDAPRVVSSSLAVAVCRLELDKEARDG